MIYFFFNLFGGYYIYIYIYIYMSIYVYMYAHIPT